MCTLFGRSSETSKKSKKANFINIKPGSIKLWAQKCYTYIYLPRDLNISTIKAIQRGLIA